MKNPLRNLREYLFLVLFVVEQCYMDVSLEEEGSVEIVGPRDFQALSGDLIVWTRLSPLVFNLTGRLEEEVGALGALGLELQRGNHLLQTVPTSLSTTWHKVSFSCRVVVAGGVYFVRLVRLLSPQQTLANTTILIHYPTIVFEVPHRIDAYTTSTPVTFGLTRSTSCEPKLALPRTVLTLSMCSSGGGKTEEDNEEVECNRDFASIFENPLEALQKEGRITTSVECHLWARNSTFRVQLREEEGSKSVIAKSRPIRVEWGSQFSINMSKATVMPCRNSVRAVVGYPGCVLPGRDKIRVYGHETLSVPSLLVPSRVSYIGEQQIRPNNRVVTFRCNLFPQRFLRFCFQYINTAVDDSVAVVVEKCIPTNPPLRLSDGGWGPWSAWTPCSVTCGWDGKQYRYRFCDNPPPSSGANFCQGEAIDERNCDDNPGECPGGGDSSIVFVDLNPPQQVPPPPPSPPETPPDVPPANMTEGCECGCILYDLVPSRNDSLVIFISSNHSAPCADEDQVDQHKLKWILQAKEEKDRVRLEIVEIDLECVTITFRDGNTTDSNLLGMITSEETEVHYTEFGNWPRLRGDDNVNVNLTLESTGASLSIASASHPQHPNCSRQFIYFIAHYSTLSAANYSSVGLQEPVGTSPVAHLPYETWTFLLLKSVLPFFLGALLLSALAGCVAKVCRRDKYKELTCFENEEEVVGGVEPGGGGGGGGGGVEDDSSRCTSVTLMSFDYTYWRRLRILRLKYFLLRPRPLEYLATKVKSFPTTPTHSRVLVKKKRKEEVPSSSKDVEAPQKSSSETSGGLVRSVSLSERNLRVKEEEKKEEKRRSKRFASEEEEKSVYCGDPSGGGVRVMPTRTGGKEGERVGSSVSISERSSTSTSTATNDDGSTSTLSEKGGVRQSEKLLKEQENLKRRASSEQVDLKKDQRLLSKSRKVSNKVRGHPLTKKDIGKSDLSMSTTQGSVRCSDDSESRGGSRMEDADHDFEMDYYDYDVLNVGTIPGSYLGLEPAFVLWNSEVYPGEEPEEPDETHLLAPCRSSVGGTSDEGMEMTTTATTASESGSPHMFSEDLYTKTSMTAKKKKSEDIKETSIDALKFADEDSDETGDSIFEKMSCS